MTKTTILLAAVVSVSPLAFAQQKAPPAPAGGGGGGGARVAPTPAPARPAPAPAPARNDAGPSRPPRGPEPAPPQGRPDPNPPVQNPGQPPVPRGRYGNNVTDPAPQRPTQSGGVGSPDPRTNPIGVNPVNPPAGAGPLTGRGIPTPPTATGRNVSPLPKNLNAPTVIVPGVLPWYGYHTPWWYGDDNPNYGGSWRDRDDYRRDAPPPPPAVTATPPPALTPSPATEQAKAINALEASPVYRQALADASAAEEAYTLAERRVLDRLKRDNPRYRQLREEKAAATDRVEAVQAAARIPSPDRVTPAAQAKLEVGSELTRTEQEAVAADPEASAAKAKLTQAQQRVTVMRKQAQAGG